MKAIVYDRFGAPDVLELREVPEPTRAPGHARVAVRAAALNPKDVLLRKGKLRWLARTPLPRTPGFDVAGVLLEDAGGLPAGAEVYGMINAHSGGGYAEVVSLPADEIARKPEGLTMAQAASLPLVGQTALQALRDDLELRAGQHVLINGASGGLGTVAVQIARAMGARVTAVCSGRNAELVTRLGAHDVIDYQTQDPKALRDLDAIFDCFGTMPWSVSKGCLTPKGRFCTAIPRAGAAARGALRRLGLHRAALVVVRSRRADLDELTRLVDAGELEPVLEATLPLDQAAEGHRMIETRRTRGKIVLAL